MTGRKEYLQSWRDSNKSYQKNWEKNNKGKRKAINERRRIKIRKWFEEYKTDLVCKFCEENENCCLDFHHIDPKDKYRTVSSMVSDSHSIKKIKEEIAKCVVLCANCHRKLHLGSRTHR